MVSSWSVVTYKDTRLPHFYTTLVIPPIIEGILGLDSLIVGYYRLQRVEDIAKLVQMIFKMYVDVDSNDGFLSAYSRLFSIRDVLSTDYLLSAIEAAVAAKERLHFDDEEIAEFANTTGMLLHSAAVKSKSLEQKEILQLRAIDVYSDGLARKISPRLKSSLLQNKAVVLDELSRINEAMKLLEESLAITTGEKSTGRAIQLYNAGVTQYKMRQIERGLQYIRDALDMQWEIVNKWDQLLTQGGRVLTSNQVFELRFAKRTLADFLEVTGGRNSDEVKRLRQEADGAIVTQSRSYPKSRPEDAFSFNFSSGRIVDIREEMHIPTLGSWKED